MTARHIADITRPIIAGLQVDGCIGAIQVEAVRQSMRALECDEGRRTILAHALRTGRIDGETAGQLAWEFGLAERDGFVTITSGE